MPLYYLLDLFNNGTWVGIPNLFEEPFQTEPDCARLSDQRLGRARRLIANKQVQNFPILSAGQRNTIARQKARKKQTKGPAIERLELCSCEEANSCCTGSSIFESSGVRRLEGVAALSSQCGGGILIPMDDFPLVSEEVGVQSLSGACGENKEILAGGVLDLFGHVLTDDDGQEIVENALIALGASLVNCTQATTTAGEQGVPLMLPTCVQMQTHVRTDKTTAVSRTARRTEVFGHARDSR